ncbi:MAG TPA: cellulose biosynthesis cyclic di-GMP-binding regulatory protein BcsB [Anaerolineae bacterium]|nr:cellulose biosynthesis cyclic di-GMP-binding regulatory protein BcsB [Anaerolineae bacterium]
MRQHLWVRSVLVALLGWLALFGGLPDAQAAPRLERTPAPGEQTVTLEQVGYREPLALRGMYGTVRVWIPFRTDWAFSSPAELSLTYRASSLLRPRSTLTVIANGLEVASISLEADETWHTVQIPIPANWLGRKGLSLRFQGYLRVTDEVCEETNNPAQWVEIAPSTALTITPALREPKPDLGQLALDLVVQGAEEYAPAPPLVFVLPDEPTDTELTTAGWLAARLAQAANTQPAFQVILASAFDPQNVPDAQVIFVGPPERLPWLQENGARLPAPWKGSGFVDAAGQVAPAGHGVIQLLMAPWNAARYVLVVSGATQEGVRRAGEVFARSRTFAALQGTFQFVGDPLPEVAPVPPPWSTDMTTFAQLGETDRKVKGTGVHNEYFYFYRPPGWVWDKGSQLILRYQTSPALTSRESYITVYINDVPVGSVRTGPDFDQHEMAFDLPVARLNRDLQGRVPSRLIVRMEVGNYLREQDCEVVHPDAAWTILQADTTFYVPHVYDSLPDLQAFPYPFVRTDAIEPTLLILPPQPVAQQIEQGLALSALLGLYGHPDLGFRLVAQVKADDPRLVEAHVVLFGAKEEHPLLQAALEKMGAVPGYRGEEGLYQALQDPGQGLLREGPSPWNKDRVALLAFGATSAGAQRALEALLKQVPPVDEPGSVALVRDNGRTQVIYRAVEQSPEFKPVVVKREPLLPLPKPWMVITAAIVVTALAVWAIVFFGRRWFGRKEEAEEEVFE